MGLCVDGLLFGGGREEAFFPSFGEAFYTVSTCSLVFPKRRSLFW
jgi:hypothetical protein